MFYSNIAYIQFWLFKATFTILLPALSYFLKYLTLGLKFLWYVNILNLDTAFFILALFLLYLPNAIYKLKMIIWCLFTVYPQEHEYSSLPTSKHSACHQCTCKKDMVLNLVWCRHFIVCPRIAVMVPGIQGEPTKH